MKKTQRETYLEKVIGLRNEIAACKGEEPISKEEEASIDASYSARELRAVAERVFADTPWHIAGTDISYSTACVRVYLCDKDGEPIRSQELNIRMEIAGYLHENEEVSVNVGTTGSFDINDTEVGSWALFYIEFGKLLADKTRMKDLQDSCRTICESENEVIKLGFKLKSILADPFKNQEEE